MTRSAKALLLALFALLAWPLAGLAQTQSVLPPGMQQFTDGNGAPYAGGKIYLYFPNTTSPKNSFKDPKGTVVNTNPLVLDANGRAIIWGQGLYRQVLKDSSGNLIWDQQTFSPAAAAQTNGSATCSAVNTTGSANAQILSPVQPVLSLTVGGIYCGVVGFTNTGPTSLEVSSTGFFSVKKQGSAGLGSLAGGELVVGQGYMFMWDGLEYQLLNPQQVVGLQLSVDSFLPPGQPDGVSDNSAAITSMVSVICAVNPSGNLVYYPPGHYQIHDVVVPCGISMVGSGASQSGQTTIDYSLGTNFTFEWQPTGWPAVTQSGKIYGVRVSDMNFYQSNPGFAGHNLVFNGVNDGVVDHVSENGYGTNGIRLFGVYKFDLRSITANFYPNVGTQFAGNGVELAGDQTGQTRAGAACTLGDCSTETHLVTIEDYDSLGSTTTGSCISVLSSVFSISGDHISCTGQQWGLNVGCAAGFAAIGYCPHDMVFHDLQSVGGSTAGVQIVDFTRFTCIACYVQANGTGTDNALVASMVNYSQSGGDGGGVTLDGGYYAFAGGSVLFFNTGISDVKVANATIVQGNQSSSGATALFFNGNQATLTSNTFCHYLGATPGVSEGAVFLGSSALNVIAIGNLFRGCASGITGTTGGLTSANNVGP